MKKKSIIGLFAGLLSLGMATTSCEDMLTPDVDRYAEGFTGRDTVSFYFGILSNVQDMVENNTLLADMRSDLVKTTEYVSDTVSAIVNFEPVADADNGLVSRAAYYKVINQCNYYLAAVDTMAQKNSIYYMRTEFAQVQFIRAWAYMQLVQNYGTVPYINKPVANAGTGWETNPEGGKWATAETLLGYLMEDGLDRAYNYQYAQGYGTPSYGTLNNGAITMPAQMMVFPGRLVMADLYLLRGASKADYQNAAFLYYQYLEEESRVNARRMTAGNRANAMRIQINNEESFHAQKGNWAEPFNDNSANITGNGQVITAMLSSASSNFGSVLMRPAQIYGFDAKSTSNTSTSEDATVSTTGKVSVTANYRNRQLTLSPAYESLSKAQVYRFCVNTEKSENSETNEDINQIKYAEDCGDCRIEGIRNYVQTTEGIIPFIGTRAYNGNNTTENNGVGTGSFKFNYSFPLYRVNQVYLRFAEALNRAGYPRHAFGVLRDGLTSKTMPTIANDSVRDGHVFPYLVNQPDGCDYIGIDEMRRAKSDLPWLDFEESHWDAVCGVHELGSGYSSEIDTVYTYSKIVGQRMYDERVRMDIVEGVTADELIAALDAEIAVPEDEEQPSTDVEAQDEGTPPSDPQPEPDPEPALDPVTPENLQEQINAVETLIADEMALEMAFQGSRFFDLDRIANHKDRAEFGPANNGTSWFAWLIARRNLGLKPYEDPAQKDNGLYQRLSVKENRYLQNPAY